MGYKKFSMGENHRDSRNDIEKNKIQSNKYVQATQNTQSNMPNIPNQANQANQPNMLNQLNKPNIYTASDNNKTPPVDNLKSVSEPLFVKSISEIEIKDAFENDQMQKLKPKKHKFPVTALAFIGLCGISTIIFAFTPIPKTVETPLKSLAAFFTGYAYSHEALWISNSNPSDTEQINSGFTAGAEAPSNQENNLSSNAENNDSSGFNTEVSSNPISLASSNMTRISNETQYTISIPELLNEPYPIASVSTHEYSDEASVEVFSQCPPEVLIIHTHGTESYSDTAQTNFRTQDKNKNVVAVGTKLADALAEKGIVSIHCEEMFDAESYIKAYSNSFSAVSEYLEEYPSIKYVIDLHRDAISDPGGGYAKLLTDVNGTSCAQLMLVVGTDEAGAQHPGWKNNLRTAFEIQEKICEKYPDLMRSVNLRRASFNQQLSPGYFILEAGNCGNTIDETMESIQLFAECFSEVVVG